MDFRQAADEVDGLDREHWAARPSVRVGPVSSDEAPAPVEDRLRRDKERQPSLAWREPGEQRDERPIGLGEAGPGDLATEHCQLVAQHKDLGLHSVDVHESEGAVSHAVEEGKNHVRGTERRERLFGRRSCPGEGWQQA